MFLKALNPEEKANFLSLVYLIAKIDGEYSEAEKEIIENYKLEMGLEYIRKGKTILELINYFASKEMPLKKLVLFKVYGLIISDNQLNKNESEVLSLMEEKFALSQDTYKAISAVVEELKSVYDRIYDVLA